MATSIGEGLATGLERGFRLSMDYADREERKQRTARLDAESAETLRRARAREDQQTEVGALDMQAKILDEQAARTSDPAARQTLGLQAKAVQERRAALAQRAGGVDLDAIRQQADLTLEDIKAGRPPQPGQFSQLLTVKLGTDPKRLLRPAPDQPSEYETDMQQFLGAAQQGDQDGMLATGNKLFAGELSRNVGKPVVRGGQNVGRLVKQEIIAVNQDPNAPPDDPRVVLMVRNYVNSGRDFNGPRPDGSPDGATGHYDAPITLNRSSDPEDPVRSIRLNEIMEQLGKKAEFAEFVNTPEGRALLEQDLNAKTFNPETYLKPFARKEVKVDYKPLGSRGSLKITTDPRTGRTTEQVIAPPPGTATGRPGAMQQKIDAIRALTEGDDPAMSEADAEIAIKALVKKETTGTKSQGLAAGGGVRGGGGSSGLGLTAAETRKITRQQDAVKTEIATIAEQISRAEQRYEQAFKEKPGEDASKAERDAFKEQKEAAKRTRDAAVAELEKKRSAAEKRQSEMHALLNLADDAEDGKAPAAPAKGGATQFARNPKTGERLKLEGGKWVPVK